MSKPSARWQLSFVLSIAAVMIYFVVTSGSGGKGSSDDKPAPAPALALPDLKGKIVSLADYKGKVVLLDFWATWCGPCAEELPDLKELQSKFGAKDFTIIGVSLDEDKRAVSAFVKDNAVPYPILLAGENPPEGYPVTAIPTAYLIDREGIIVQKYFGPQPFEAFAADIKPLLH